MPWSVTGYIIVLMLHGAAISQTPEDSQDECLLYTEYDKISQMCFGNTTTKSLIFWRVNTFIIDVDVDVENQCVYYSQLLPTHAAISMVCLNDLTKYRPIVATKLRRIEGIAFDWTSNNVYWVETDRQDYGGRISVTPNDGKHRKVLYQGYDVLGRAREITLHPELGLLFWTDWSEVNPRIMRASMAGDPESVQTLVEGKDKLRWINGIDLDLSTNTLYWIDAKLDHIGSVSIDGQNFTILQKLSSKSRGYGLGISPDYIYWTDWNNNGLFRVNKTGDGEINLIKTSKYQPRGLSVWIKKPVISFPPENVTCPHLMLPDNDVETGRAARHCYCADGYNMLRIDDHVTCSLKERVEPGVNKTLCEGFLCADNTTCIELILNCDGDMVCYDGSDEQHCGVGASLNGTVCLGFQCEDNRTCIPVRFKCDGEMDCYDGSDEQSCGVDVDALVKLDECLVYTTLLEIRWTCPYNKTNGTLVREDGLVTDVDVDHQSRCIFYAVIGYGKYKIKEFCRFKLPVSERERTFVSNVTGAVEGLAFDWIGQNLYWLDQTNKQLIVTDRANRFSSVLYEGSVFRSARDLILHPERGLLFWTDWSRQRTAIMRASMAGNDTTIKTIVSGSRLVWPNSLALDADNNHIYWVDAKFNKISRCGLSGEGITRFETGIVGKTHLYGIAISQKYIYLSDWRLDSIMRTTKDPISTRSATTIVTGLRSPKGIAVMRTKVKDVPDRSCPLDCPHLCLPNYLDGYAGIELVCRCSDGYTLKVKENEQYVCEKDAPASTAGNRTACPEGSGEPPCEPENIFDDCLVYTTGHEIRRMCPYNDTYETLIKGENIGETSLTRDVDVDYSHRCFFYTTYTTSKAGHSYSVKEFCQFGSPVADHMGTFVNNLGGTADGLAYDWLGQNLYWIHIYTKQIIVTDRANRYSSVLYEGPVFRAPQDLIVHPARGLLFWTDWSYANPSIKRASMAGDVDSIKTIVDVTEVDWPNSVALDAENNHIYWVDGKLHKIGRCGLNGEELITVRSLKKFTSLYGIAVSEKYIYFSDWSTGTIAGISKDPKSRQQPTVFVRGLNTPRGLAVLPKRAKDIPPSPCPWGCSQLCLIGYLEGQNRASPSCRCSTGFKSIIGNNRRISCVQDTSPPPGALL